jgi:hypothetical protein
VFYVHHAGTVGGEPEPRTWEDIVAMCRSGHLSPESLIFFPDENGWQKAADTDLAQLFGERGSPADDPGPDQNAQAELKDEYNQLRRQLEGTPADWNQMVQLAEMALTVGDRAGAIKHFQEALNSHRYHPRVRRRIKQCLSRDEWQNLRYFSRQEPIWEDVVGLVSYPFTRGPLYLAIPTVVFAALFWIPAVALAAVLLLYLWVAEVIRATANGDTKPPLWHGAVSDPVNTVLKSLGVALIVGAELYLPFLLVATIMATTGGVQSDAWTVMQKSPLMIVIMATLTLLYVPAVLVIAGGSEVDIKRIANPRQVIFAILKMEHEYVASIGIVAVLVAIWGILSYVFSFIPFVGHVVAVALGMYVLVTAGLVVGRLQSRFSEQLNELS